MKHVLKVMIADADEQMGKQLAKYLNEKADVEVLPIQTSGKGVLRAIKTEEPDVVLLDLVLPGMDGLSVLEELMRGKCKSSVIVTSAMDNSRMITYACQLGADFYICKPYDEERVYHRLRQLYMYRQQETEKQEEAELFLTQEEEENETRERISLESKITREIRLLGIPAHIKGYQYIRSSVLLSLRDGSMLNFVTKSLYPEVAKIYGTTTGSVERAIRHAIAVAWERGNREAIKQLYGYDYGIHSRRPTNSEFLSLVVDKFRMEEKNHVQAAG